MNITKTHIRTDLLHLTPLEDRRLTGPAVTDQNVRLDFEGFRAAVSATALRLEQLGIGQRHRARHFR